MSELAVPTTSALPTQSVSAESLLSAPDTGMSVTPQGRPSNSTKATIPARKMRVKAPKKTKIYKTVKVYIAMKAQGFKTAEVAEQLGILPSTLRQYVYKANREGWLDYQGSLELPEDRLDMILASKAVRNLEEVLDERGAEPALGEKQRLTHRATDISLEVAKGIGLLKQHQVSKSEGSTNNVFALRVEVVNPLAGQPTITLPPGSFGGTGHFADAEIVE